jgi:glycosyltransferase 2 family protein
VSNATLEDVWRQVARLHAAGISHGRLNLSNVLVVDDRPMLIDLSAATVGAPRLQLDIDVAELLVACTVLVGAERTLSKAVEAGWATRSPASCHTCNPPRSRRISGTSRDRTRWP